MKTIGIVTLDSPHLKTEQVLEKLVPMGYELKVFALPFDARKARTPLIGHRPDQFTGRHCRELAKGYAIDYSICEKDTDIAPGCDFYLMVCGKLLSADCLAGKRFINCHPGVIPAARGLDAFKWALCEMKPLGVTLHYIDEEVDHGEIISIVPTPVYKSDTLEDLAMRHYQNEVEINVDFEKHLKSPSNPFASIESGVPRMRMPRVKEAFVVEQFPDYLRMYGL